MAGTKPRRAGAAGRARRAVWRARARRAFPTTARAARCRACWSWPPTRPETSPGRATAARPMPVALPAQHLVAGDLQARQRRAHEIGNQPEVFRGDLRAGGDEQLQDAFALPALLRLVGGVERADGLAKPAGVRAEEPDEVIDAIAVVEARHAPRALAQPAIVLRGHHVPPIDGQSPVLARRAEGIRRRADGAVEAEDVLVGPDVGAVGADHERKVAKQADLAQLFARRLPLRVGEPLHVLMKENLLLQLAPCLLERPGCGRAAAPATPSTGGRRAVPAARCRGRSPPATTPPTRQTRQTRRRAPWCAASPRPRTG